MKTALYIEDDIAQIVLTPETEFEKSLFNDHLAMTEATVKLQRGEFYANRAGFIRNNLIDYGPRSEEQPLSAIITIRPRDGKS